MDETRLCQSFLDVSIRIYLENCETDARLQITRSSIPGLSNSSSDVLCKGKHLLLLQSAPNELHRNMGAMVYFGIVVFLCTLILLTDWLEVFVHLIDLLINTRYWYSTGRVIESVVNIRVWSRNVESVLHACRYTPSHGTCLKR